MNQLLPDFVFLGAVESGGVGCWLRIGQGQEGFLHQPGVCRLGEASEVERSIFQNAFGLEEGERGGQGEEREPAGGKGRPPANGQVVREVENDGGRRGEAGITQRIVEDTPP